MLVNVLWETTDQHTALIEVPGDRAADIDENDLLERIAEIEGGGTSFATIDRVVVEVRDAN